MIGKLLTTLALSLAPVLAHAHVKWFSTMADCVSIPLAPLDVMSSPLFIGVGLAALAAMAAVMAIDGWISRSDNPATRAAAWIENRAADLVSPLLRHGLAAYFVAVAIHFHASPILLTPELKTDAAWVPVLQMLIAAMLPFRRGAALASLGIVLLYAHAVHVYGWYHMLDYPFFIGMAVFLYLDAVHGRGRRALALNILRATLGLSFLWVSVEKWMYPDWTYEILRLQLRQLLMGFDIGFFVLGAGFVEFCLAFTLISGSIASRVAAAVLMTMLMAAIPMVGMTDAIGHAPLIVLLFLCAVTGNGLVRSAVPARRRHGLRHMLFFLASVPGLAGAYYLSHEFAYSGLHHANPVASVSAALLMLPLLCTAASLMPGILGRAHIWIPVAPVGAVSWLKGAVPPRRVLVPVSIGAVAFSCVAGGTMWMAPREADSFDRVSGRHGAAVAAAPETMVLKLSYEIAAQR